MKELRSCKARTASSKPCWDSRCPGSVVSRTSETRTAVWSWSPAEESSIRRARRRRDRSGRLLTVMFEAGAEQIDLRLRDRRTKQAAAELHTRLAVRGGAIFPE